MTVRSLDALVLFTRDLEAAVRFYRAIGLSLEEERHDDGPVHYACELGGVHVAVYGAHGAGVAPARRHAGASQVGFTVDDLDRAVAAGRSVGAPVLVEREQMPWGDRALLGDPDGRTVELNQPAAADA